MANPLIVQTLKGHHLWFKYCGTQVVDAEIKLYVNLIVPFCKYLSSKDKVELINIYEPHKCGFFTEKCKIGKTQVIEIFKRKNNELLKKYLLHDK